MMTNQHDDCWAATTCGEKTSLCVTADGWNEGCSVVQIKSWLPRRGISESRKPRAGAIGLRIRRPAAPCVCLAAYVGTADCPVQGCLQPVIPLPSPTPRPRHA